MNLKNISRLCCQIGGLGLMGNLCLVVILAGLPQMCDAPTAAVLEPEGEPEVAQEPEQEALTDFRHAQKQQIKASGQPEPDYEPEKPIVPEPETEILTDDEQKQGQPTKNTWWVRITRDYLWPSWRLSKDSPLNYVLVEATRGEPEYFERERIAKYYADNLERAEGLHREIEQEQATNRDTHNTSVRSNEIDARDPIIPKASFLDARKVFTIRQAGVKSISELPLPQTPGKAYISLSSIRRTWWDNMLGNRGLDLRTRLKAVSGGQLPPFIEVDTITVPNSYRDDRPGGDGDTDTYVIFGPESSGPVWNGILTQKILTKEDSPYQYVIRTYTPKQIDAMGYRTTQVDYYAGNKPGESKVKYSWALKEPKEPADPNSPISDYIEVDGKQKTILWLYPVQLRDRFRDEAQTGEQAQEADGTMTQRELRHEAPEGSGTSHPQGAQRGTRREPTQGGTRRRYPFIVVYKK